MASPKTHDHFIIHVPNTMIMLLILRKSTLLLFLWYCKNLLVYMTYIHCHCMYVYIVVVICTYYMI